MSRPLVRGKGVYKLSLLGEREFVNNCDKYVTSSSSSKKRSEKVIDCTVDLVRRMEHPSPSS